jgi:predicted transcriptional regulator
MATVNVKQEVRHLLDQLPDDVSLEQIQYHLYVRQKIEHALQEADAGNVISQEEAEERMAKWLGE